MQARLSGVGQSGGVLTAGTPAAALLKLVEGLVNLNSSKASSKWHTHTCVRASPRCRCSCVHSQQLQTARVQILCQLDEQD
jgi:hypothetical protein